MIYTVTINPAIDRTLVCENFKSGGLNRAIKVREDIGGKGVNVSKFLHVLGERSIACGFLGDDHSQVFTKKLDRLAIRHQFFLLKNQRTRTNLKIIDFLDGSLTEINEPGLNISPAELEDFIQELFTQVQADDYVVLSGSLPESVEPNFYPHFLERIKQKTDKLIIDLTGSNLSACLKYQPLFIKPNLFEFESMLGKELRSQEEIIAHGQAFIRSLGFDTNLLLSVGNQGAYFFNSTKTYFLPALDITVKSPVGAGDGQVGAFVFALKNKLSLEDSLRLTSAVATAKVVTEGTDIPDKNLIEKYFNQARCQEIL